MTWRDKLLRALEDRGLTQYRLAQETGLRQSRISLWLGGKGEPGLEEWGLMCRVLDLPIAHFLDDAPSTIADYRTPEEQMLIRVAKKVGVQAIWELIAEAAVGRSARIAPPSPGPIAPIRDVPPGGTNREPGEDDEDGTGRKPDARRPRRKG